MNRSDLKDFGDLKKKEKILEKALYKTLEKLNESIGGNPTVFWTGNGYHVYQSVSGWTLFILISITDGKMQVYAIIYV